MSRKDRKLKVFSAQNEMISKKKVFAKIQSDFSAEIQNSNVFSAQNWVISKKKKKKRSSPKFRAIFLPLSQVQTYEGGLFSYGGGAIFHFPQKIGLKSTKNMRFCILHKPMGGSSPPAPPPGYATGQDPDGRDRDQDQDLEKIRDQDLKKFSRPRSRLGEFVRDRDETSRPEILEAKLICIDY